MFGKSFKNNLSWTFHGGHKFTQTVLSGNFLENRETGKNFARAANSGALWIFMDNFGFSWVAGDSYYPVIWKIPNNKPWNKDPPPQKKHDQDDFFQERFFASTAFRNFGGWPRWRKIPTPCWVWNPAARSKRSGLPTVSVHAPSIRISMMRPMPRLWGGG